MSIRPENVLSDDQDTGKFGNILVRKGTVGAALANAEILEAINSTEAEKNAARCTLQELAPALIALGLQKYLTWKNPEIQKIMDQYVKE